MQKNFVNKHKQGGLVRPPPPLVWEVFPLNPVFFWRRSLGVMIWRLNLEQLVPSTILANFNKVVSNLTSCRTKMGEFFCELSLLRGCAVHPLQFDRMQKSVFCCAASQLVSLMQGSHEEVVHPEYDDCSNRSPSVWLYGDCQDVVGA